MNLLTVKLELDLGSGSMVVVPHSRLSPELNLKQTIDGYGGAELTFTLFEVGSPLVTTYLRSMRRARLTLYWGTPGNISSAIYFDGVTRDATWSRASQSAAIVCQDLSAQYANQLISYSIPEFDGKSRETVISEVLTATSVPVGSVDCPGTIYKAINEGGDKSVLDWLATFAAAAGRRVLWRPDGKVYVESTDLGSPVITLKASDVVDVDVASPAHNAPNTIRFVAAIYTDDDAIPADGTYTVTDSVSGSYTPAAAVRKQSSTDGAITTVSPSVSVETEVARTVTSKTYSGGRLTYTVIQEYKWMAPFAPRSRQLPNAGYSVETVPTISFNASHDVYDFDDGGHWRSQDTETFQIWRETRITENYSGDTHTGRVTEVGLWTNEYPQFGTVLGFNASGPGNYAWRWADVLMWDADQGSDRVSWPIAPFASGSGMVITDVFTRDDGGDVTTVSREMLVNRVDGYYYRMATGFPSVTGVSQIGLYHVFGNLSQPRHNESNGNNVEGRWVVGYLPNTDTSRLGQVIAVAGSPTAINRPFGYEGEIQIPAPGNAAPVDARLLGTFPDDEQRRVPQPTAVTTTDATVTALNGTITANDRNDYCETEDEIRQCGKDVLRRNLSPVVTITRGAPAGDVIAGDTIALDMRDVSSAAVDLLVREMQLAINLKTGAATQTFVCPWYPAELV